MKKQNIMNRRLGLIAINKGYATRQEVDRALLEQNRLKTEGTPHIFIGDILVKLGVLTEEQRDEILALQKDFRNKAPDKTQTPSTSKGVESLKAIDTRIALEVSVDKTEAYIYPGEEDYNGICVDSIKELLELEGIKYGIIDDKKISAHLSQPDISKEPWMIAKGNKSVDMKISDVKYYFDTATKRGEGPMAPDTGKIKAKSEPPNIKKGDLLAELVLDETGSSGFDVYGDPIPVTIPGGINFHCATGAKKSEDGLKIFSQIDGRPELLSDGTICVFPILHISGDVDIETKNLEFDGHIEIEGALEEGFCVKARSLKVKRVDKAEVEVEGDIDIVEGAIGATINTGGKLVAGHVRSSSIDAFGDVIVDGEMVNSMIHTDGACIVKEGRILSSKIDAKKGIKATEIGSASSRPCKLTVGIDSRFQKNFENFKKEIAKEEKEKTRFENLVAEFQQKALKVEEIITEATQMESRILAQQVALKNKTEDIDKTDDSVPLAEAEVAIKQLDTQINKIQKKAQTLFDKQERISEKVAAYQSEARESERQISDLQKKVLDLAEQSKSDKGQPIVDVSGTLFAQTSILGPNVSLTCHEDYQNICINVTKKSIPSSFIQRQ
jgi:uncharacterized protein (DUF342 family)